uniref:Abhydrolase domain-containing protein 3 n=1 Tax=Aceria tosichella TaxID=561515 RepID=A0A6G1SJS7_9ACAR
MSMQFQELFAYTPDWILESIPKLSLVNLMSCLKNSVGDFYVANPGTSVFLCVFMLYYVYYLKNVVKKPELVCSNETFRQFLIENCPIIDEEFKPTVWCSSHHGQTLLSNTIRMAIVPIPQYRREFVPVDDDVPPKPGQNREFNMSKSKNSTVTLDWYEGPGPTIQLPDGQKFYAELLEKYNVEDFVYSPKISEDDGKPIAVFYPGLVGDSQTEYVRTAVIMANSLGYKTCVFNNRSRGGLLLKTPRLYCAANYDDLEASLQHIKMTHPNSKIVAIGISLGGIVLCRYLAERGDDALVDAAMLVSVCFDFRAGLASLTEPGFNSMLNLHLTKSLIRLVEENREILEKTGKYDIDEIIASKNLAQFDERFTHKMWNYSSVEEYHEDASNKNRIHKIRKPTLCINAADDIFCPYSALPLKQIQDNPKCAMLVTARGGHIGWMDTNLAILKPALFYLERLIVQFLEAVKNKTSDEILNNSKFKQAIFD